MQVAKVKVVNPTGLHARPAAAVVQTANSYESDITLRREGEEEGCNAKSIIMLLASAFSQGTALEIVAEGPDEEQAVEGLAACIAQLTE